ncbi:hypothetical protein [Endozoicomonas sp. ALD040]|uniref:hypothetical protein n=1 Tax=Endozoicomonas sp. ALD040 TaxID=3403079 RepID=UPI003BB11707
MYRIKIFILLSAVLLSACSTAPKNAASYIDAKIGIPSEDKAVLVIYRQMVPPVAYSVSAEVDGKPIAKLPNNTFTWTYLEEGDHNIKIKWPFMALTPSKEYVLNIVPGNYYYVEFGGDLHVGWINTAIPYTVNNLSPIDPKKAEHVLTECCSYMPARL